MKAPPHVLSVDLGDWFHISYNPEAQYFNEWDKLKSKIGRNTDRLIALFGQHRVKATFFVLGC